MIKALVGIISGALAAIVGPEPASGPGHGLCLKFASTSGCSGSASTFPGVPLGSRLRAVCAFGSDVQESGNRNPIGSSRRNGPRKSCWQKQGWSTVKTGSEATNADLLISGGAMESVVDFACFLDGAATLDYATYGAGASQLVSAVEPGATGSTAAPVRKRLRDDRAADETPVSHKYNGVERRGRLPAVAVASPPPVPSPAAAWETPAFSRLPPGSDSREPADHEPEFEERAAVELDSSVVDAAVHSICTEFAEENAESVRLAVLALGLAASQQLQEDVRRTEVGTPSRDDHVSTSCVHPM